DDMFNHTDLLAELNINSTLSDKLAIIYRTVKTRYPFIDRIALASYDDKSDIVKTFLATNNGDNPLANYSAPLASAPSLKEIVTRGTPRVINDLAVFSDGRAEHTRRIGAKGYGSSYTMPLLLNGKLGGFLFFNSYQKGSFQESVLAELDLIGHLIA